MAGQYLTAEGDALDLICYRAYGAQAGVAEQVLEVNPHIKANAHDLPAGVTITLPDLNPRATAAQTARLWD